MVSSRPSSSITSNMLGLVVLPVLLDIFRPAPHCDIVNQLDGVEASSNVDAGANGTGVPENSPSPLV